MRQSSGLQIGGDTITGEGRPGEKPAGADRDDAPHALDAPRCPLPLAIGARYQPRDQEGIAVWEDRRPGRAGKTAFPVAHPEGPPLVSR